MRQHEEVRDALEAVLAGTPGVTGAAYFGSTARGGTDRFSDVDLLVRCPADAASRFVAGLHARLGIVLFRPFSEDRRPSGRYWFAGTNPFARLDVSFHDASGFDRIVESGHGYTQPPFATIRLDPAAVPLPTAPSGLPLPDPSPVDRDFAGALRRFQESAKQLARGREPERPLEQAEDALLAYRGRHLRKEIWRLYEDSLTVMRRSA